MLFVLILLLLSGCGGGEPIAAPAAQVSPLVPSRVLEKREEPLLECLFYEEEDFHQSLQAQPVYQWEGQARAGIVPHHLLAADMIAAFFSAVSQQTQDYDRVIIFSTAHYPAKTQGKTVTSSRSWNTAFGRVPTDQEFVRTLLQDPALGAEENHSAVEKDHGVAALIPYVKYYLPKVRVGVCLVPNRLTYQQLRGMQELFVELADNRTLLVGSVDFSHYLQPEEAALRDEETRVAMESLDIDSVSQFTDDHADSPIVLSSLLHLVTQQERQLILLDHSSSPEKLGMAYSNQLFQEGTTTYFIYCIT